MISYKPKPGGQSTIGFIEMDEIYVDIVGFYELLDRKTKKDYGEDAEFESIISRSDGIHVSPAD